MKSLTTLPILGIDLGTVNTRACILQEGNPEPVIIHPEPVRASDLMPSVFCNTGKTILVGASALEKLMEVDYRDDVVRGVKRYLKYEGKTFKSGGIRYPPEEISGFFLKAIREAAEHQLNLPSGTIAEAVVTVPAYFGHRERRLTRLAGERYGGFSRIYLLDEPIAAAIGLKLHEHTHGAPGEELVLVVDLGGGTFDVTLLYTNSREKGGGFRELSRDGDDHLGGIDWDKEMVRLALFNRPNTLDDNQKNEVLDESNLFMYEPCERAKLDFFAGVTSKPIECEDFRLGVFTVTLSCEDFLAQTADLAACCGRICDRLLKTVPAEDIAAIRRKRSGWMRFLPAKRLAKISWADIDRVILVGGGGTTPAVCEQLKKRFKKKLTAATKPQFQTAIGAAWYARWLAATDDRKEFPFQLRSAHTTGIKYFPRGRRDPADTGVFYELIRRNTRIPLTTEEIPFEVTGKGNTLSIQVVEERISRLTDEPEYSKVKDVDMSGLPPPIPGQDDFVYFIIDYPTDQEMSLIVKFRGREDRGGLNGS